MAGRRRRNSNKRLRSSCETSRANVASTSTSADDGRYHNSALPHELLEKIFAPLLLKENIRASAVCKSWFRAALSVRQSNKPQWLFSYPKQKSGANSNIFQLYDPLNRKMQYLELPELRGSRICYAKGAWLLLFKPRTRRIFFFCPYTQEKIKMPKLTLADHLAAFSDPPTSPMCTLFTVRHVAGSFVAVSTCHPGAAAWTTVNYHSPTPFFSSIWNKFLFSDGLFYCFSLAGWLGVYDHTNGTWAVSTVGRPECLTFLLPQYYWRSRFIAEFNGQLYLVCTCGDTFPYVYHFDKEKNKWVEVRTLGGLSIFLSYSSCSVVSDLLGEMRNSLFFPKVQFFGKRCFTYSLAQAKYCPKKRFYDWNEEIDSFGDAWIDAPPEELSIPFI